MSENKGARLDSDAQAPRNTPPQSKESRRYLGDSAIVETIAELVVGARWSIRVALEEIGAERKIDVRLCRRGEDADLQPTGSGFKLRAREAKALSDVLARTAKRLGGDR